MSEYYDIDVDPDLAIEDCAFEDFVDYVVDTVLDGDVADTMGAVDATTNTDTADVTGDEGSVVFSDSGDSLTSLPGGGFSFSGSDGSSFSTDF